MRVITILTSAAVMIAICAAPTRSQAQNPSGRAAATPAGAVPSVSPQVDEILTRMENRKVNDLHAKLKWTIRDALGDEDSGADRKRGEIWYASRSPVPVFLIKFRDRSSAGRNDRIDEQYLFDGEWYVELINRVVTRRQVRTQKDSANPYRLGEGPFPVPFGQTKSDILRELEVSVAEKGADDPKDTDHLVLTPRPGTQMAGKYGAIHFWVKSRGAESGLPIKVMLDKLDGNGRVSEFMEIEFSDAELDKGISEKVFEIKTPPGAEEIVEPLQQ